MGQNARLYSSARVLSLQLQMCHARHVGCKQVALTCCALQHVGYVDQDRSAACQDDQVHCADWHFWVRLMWVMAWTCP